MGRPKLWFVAPKFGVFSEVWMYRQAILIDRFEVDVLCHRHDNAKDFPAEGFRVLELDPAGDWFRRAHRWLLRSLPFRRSTRGFDQPAWLAAAWKTLIAANNYKCILVHYGTEAVRWRSQLQSSGIPFAIHFNGHDLSKKLNDRRYVNELLPVVKAADGLIVVAQYMEDWLLERGIEPAKVHRIPYGVPLAEFPSAVRVTEPCRFLFVGRLTDKKAPLLTIRAFALAQAAQPDVRLTIIGGGELQQACQALIAELGLQHRVEMLGPQPAEVVRRELQTAAVYVQHSCTPASGDREGWPVAIAEAAAAALPIVSTRHASIPEQVLHGGTGFLVDELDWRGMGRYMLELATDPALRQRMGAEARAHIAQWETRVQVDRLENVLEETAARERG